jgi:putative addiction module component (TIGR02574 family)
MVLPTAWKERLGSLESTRTIQLETATQEILIGEVCGPVRIQIEGFPAIYSEVSFVEMKPENGEFEPLIGYIVLEQSQAGVDILGHRLVPIKHMDLKVFSGPILSSWDRIPDSLDDMPIPEWHRAELERRLAAADDDPNGAVPWEEVRVRLRKKSGAVGLLCGSES